jgi:hypothetical protein
MDEVRRMLETTFGYEFYNRALYREELEREVLAEELREADSRFYSYLIAAVIGVFVLIGVIVAVHA